MTPGWICVGLVYWRRASSKLRCVVAKATGVELGAGCSLAPDCDVALGFDNARRGQVKIGVCCVLERGVIIHPYGGEVRLGERVYLGPGVVIYGHGRVEVGDDTLVSMHCRILSSNHTVPSGAETIRSYPDIKLPTKIGRDVWLGAGVTVLGGVTIGDGCVVGAGAVVSKNLPPGTIAKGVPARVTSSRGGQ